MLFLCYVYKKIRLVVAKLRVTTLLYSLLVDIAGRQLVSGRPDRPDGDL